MAARELVVLGTASQAPTRHRNHNGYFLRWDGEGLLFDPGEGTQRQMLLAGIPSSAITRILVTHFHGDHCLGLPGVIQRLSLDRAARPVSVYYPASGAAYFERLRAASVFAEQATLVPHPVTGAGEVAAVEGAFRILAQPLRHSVDALGWRLEEAPGVRMLAKRLEAAGIRGPDVGRLQADGAIEVGGATVRLEEVSAPRPGQSFAFVMDTAPCPGATALADGADLLVAESTFLAPEQDLAEAWGHMTAADAARLAAEAGARRLLLTHFSQRHPEEGAFLAEAAPIFPEVVAARDLMTVEVPRRRGLSS